MIKNARDTKFVIRRVTRSPELSGKKKENIASKVISKLGIKKL